MTYRVELTLRANRDLERLFERINAADGDQAREWFNGLEAAILSLEDSPARCPRTPETPSLRHLLFGRPRDVYRVIFKIDERHSVVTVLHIRHGARRPISG